MVIRFHRIMIPCLHQFEIMNDPDYQKGVFDIGFLESHQIGGVKVNEA